MLALLNDLSFLNLGSRWAKPRQAKREHGTVVEWLESREVLSAAAFVQADTTTEGNWRASYASDGYNVLGDSAFGPSYAQVSASGQQLNVWAASTSDARALAKASTPGDRIAADWTAASNFTIDVNITDANTHQVALYLLDWDNSGRNERIDVLDASTLTVLNSQTASNFSNGEYLSWDISGHVKFRITSLNSQSAVASGIFFTPPGGALGDYILTPNDRIPNFGEHPTITSMASGNWSNPSTWSLGRLPTAGDLVDIMPGDTVSYDLSSTADLNTVEIQAGGELDFRTDINTEVVVQNFVVLQGGTLTVGTAANPVAANVTAQIIIGDQALNTTSDPERFGNGLIALGNVTMHGASLSDSFVELAAEAHVGDTTLSLAQAVTGWKVGDSLVLPDSRQLDWNQRKANYSPQDERLTVAAISADGKTITLTSALQFSHLGGRDVNGNLVYFPHVGNITRNVFVKSQTPSDIANRGQVMFTDRANIDVEYVGFYGLGRTQDVTFDDTTFSATGTVTHAGTNEEDRNPVQFRDLNGPTAPQADGYQYTFVGNAITCLTFDPMPIVWGINVNNSHYGLIEDNVLYNWGGAGLVTKTGAETGNRIDHNFVMDITGSGVRIDTGGMAGDGFWLRGPNNRIDNNVAAQLVGGDVYTYGFDVFEQYLGTVQIPAFQGADPTLPGQSLSVDMNAMPLMSFSGNEVYGATSGGMAYWWLGAQSDTPVGTGGVIENLQVWNIWSFGIYGYHTSNLTIDNFVDLGDSADLATVDLAIGIWSSDYRQNNLTINHANIQGTRIGIETPLDQTGTTTIENSYLRTADDILISTMTSTNGSAGLPAKLTVIRNVKFDTLPGVALTAIDMVYTLTGAGDGQSNTNLIQLDQVFVYDYNQVSGDDFQVYYSQQVASFIVPQTNNDPLPLIGSPVAGLTNQQNWDRFGIAIAGAIAPANTTTRAGINNGLIVAITGSPSPSPPGPPPVFNGTPDERFIEHLYSEFLGRQGAQVELDNWVGLLHALGRAEIVTMIARSREAYAHIIDGYYEEFLQRHADASGIAAWTSLLERGVSNEVMVSQILASPEFYQRANADFGSGNGDAGFLQGLYHDLLGRAAGDSEIANWEHELPLLGRASIALDFLDSAEYRAGIIREYYSQVLGRPTGPGPSEVENWVATPLDLYEIELGFAASDEFYSLS